MTLFLVKTDTNNALFSFPMICYETPRPVKIIQDKAILRGITL